MPWEPSDFDLQWQRSMLSTIKDGGVWAVPANQSVYQINQSSHTYKLLVGDTNDECNKRIALVFERIGWSSTE
jgi:hypothetical protein